MMGSRYEARKQLLEKWMHGAHAEYLCYCSVSAHTTSYFTDPYLHMRYESGRHDGLAELAQEAYEETGEETGDGTRSTPSCTP